MVRARQLLPLPVLAVLSPLAAAQWSTDQLSIARQDLAGTSAGGFALFAGGDPITSRVDVYDPYTNPHWSQHELSQARIAPMAVSMGGLAFFAGGSTNQSGHQVVDTVDVYDSTTGPPTDPAAWSVAHLSVPRWEIAATAVGTKVMFAGGERSGPPPVYYDVVDIYDAALGPVTDPAAWSTAQLSLARAQIGATSVGDKAFFAGGGTQGGATTHDVVDVYDDSTGTWSQTTLPHDRRNIAAVTVGDLAIFAGGDDCCGTTAFVDIYDHATDTWSTSALSQGRMLHEGVAVGDKAVFGGGFVFCCAQSNRVDIFDASTGTWSTSSLSVGRSFLAAASVDGLALFAGGYGPTAAVDIFDPVLGESYCMAEPNSIGRDGAIVAAGSAFLADNDLTLTATRLPNNANGFFLCSRTQGLVAMPGTSQGNLCLGGAIGRYVGPGQVQNSSFFGAFSLALDLGQTPTPTGLIAIQSGETWSFQAWHRDMASGGGSTSNFTNGLVITFY